MGTLTNNFQMSHILDYSVDGGRNLVRDPGVPRQRAVFSNTYSLNDLTLAYNINMIGDQYTDVDSDPDGADGYRPVLLALGNS